MGRTVLPFSMVLAEQQQRLSQFRRTLRKQDQELFDELFERARLHVQAAVQSANPDPMESIFLSVLIEMLREEKRLQTRVDELEKELRGKDAEP
jgi:FKBP-type peptidyl-prolyl cis-trans isomerase (trigger factor)